MKYYRRLLSYNIKMYSQLTPKTNSEISYISAQIAKQIDEDLMGKELKYATEQLMEVAGQSVALAIHDVITKEPAWKGINKILTISGPGNNGGDGLVTSRYLKDFGYNVDVLYPKRVENNFIKSLVSLCESYDIGLVENELENIINGYDLVIDSIFGYSFKGEIRSPFDRIIKVIVFNLVS
jgi:NAD(P)H-hydrate epimerase